MAMKLEVAEYCHNCPNFEAETEIRFNKQYPELGVSTTIRCTHRDICNSIADYIYNQIKYGGIKP